MKNPGKHLAHASILYASTPEERLRAARRLAAAAVCTAGGSEPCGLCRACRKVAADIHPDVITIRRLTDDKGRLKKEIIVGQIREMGADAYVLPNEAARKVYIIEEADKMNPQAQNAALKLLEEPPAGVVFLLCAANPSQLLPTVRSRCAELRVGVEEAETDEESAGLVAGCLAALATGDRAELLRWCAANEGLDNRRAAAFFEALYAAATDRLCGRAGAQGLTKEQLLALAALARRCADYLRVNTGVKHIFGLLAVNAPVSSGNRGNDLDRSNQY